MVLSCHFIFGSLQIMYWQDSFVRCKWGGWLATVNFIFNIFASLPKLIYPLMLISWGHCSHKFVDFTILLPKPGHQLDVFSYFNFDKIHVALIEAFFKIIFFFLCFKLELLLCFNKWVRVILLQKNEILAVFS